MRETEWLVRCVVAEVSHCPLDVDRFVDLFVGVGLVPGEAYLLLIELEELFNIHIPDDEFVTARCIAQLTSLVESLSNRMDDEYR